MRVVLLFFVAVFIGIKTVSAQTRELPPAAEITTVKLSELNYPICYCAIDKEAGFPGGEEAMMKYIHHNFRLNPVPKGRLITSFIIEKDGSLSEISVIKSLNKLADEEAIRVIKSMPNWMPSIRAGKAFRVSYALPFNFSNSLLWNNQ